MTINCIKEMNLYFHMQNHYKKLRSAKSQIDISKHPNLPMSKSENQLRVYRVNERYVEENAIFCFAHFTEL